MNKIIRINLDMPLNIDEECIGKEHNQNFIATQTKENLVYEFNPYNIRNGLLYPGLKVSDCNWIYRPLPCTFQSSNQENILIEIINHLLKKIKLKANAWLTKIISNISIVNKTISIETRMEVNYLDSLLNDPALSIGEIEGNFLGDYVLKEENGVYIFRGNKPNIINDFLVLDEFSKYQDIDIHWGIGTPTSYFEESDSMFSKEDYLPLFYFVKAGKYITNEVWGGLTKNLSTEFLKNPAVIPTSSRVINYLNYSKKDYKVIMGSNEGIKINLYYANYEPNSDIAKEISRISGGILIPTIVEYSDIVLNLEKLQDGIILNIKSPKHGGLIGHFPELYSLSSIKNENYDKFKKILHFCVKNDIKKIKKEDAVYIEEEINAVCRQFILGRLRPRFRTNMYIPITNTGLIKLSHIR
ncbi:hypothetical protein [Rosenbergiella nectarea]|uniref:hypothetical protein n=1 Tax=Rosenbergiella nectarea TaxID=988801 RepID=UPI001BDB4D2D|nr:hypothetical protein [Rosenbergiella nectarea]MBT0729500.1 hypothetical protein [Rosenbergiella nectarea subsp. apis]